VETEDYKMTGKRLYKVIISEEDGVRISMHLRAYKAARAIRWVLKHHFLHMDTQDDQSIYHFAPLDNTGDLVRYLREADIFATVEPT
jgi:hypothetical protein